MRAVIFLVTLAVIGISAGTIIVGTRSFDGVVEKHPYEHGLHWDERQAKDRNLGWSAEYSSEGLKPGKQVLAMKLVDKQGTPLHADSVAVTVSRPSTTAYDRTYPGEFQDGFYRTAVELPLYGYWDLNVRIKKGADETVSTRRIYVKK